MSGSLDHSPDQILRELLINLGGGTDPDDSGSWPIYAVREPETPDNVITITGTTGYLKARVMSGYVYEHPGAQIRIRAYDQSAAYVKANALAVLIDAIALKTVTLDSSTYVVFNVKRTGPILNVGKEVPQSKRHVYTINVVVNLRQTS